MSKREIRIVLLITLIAGGLMTWSAIYVIDNFLFIDGDYDPH